MMTLARLAAVSVWTMGTVFSVSAAADYEGASGYGPSTTTYEFDVAHDGYPRGDEVSGEAEAAAEPPNYVVIEVEEGVSQEVEGETVIVVQEPEPIAATEAAPPSPRVAAVEQPAARCPGGIWVDGYWTYGDGQYVWVDGHCVVERVNYVFVHPRWDFYANVWWFVPGYYRPCGAWVGFGYYRPSYWFPPYHRPYYRGYRGVPVHRGAPRAPMVRVGTPTNRIPTMGRHAPRNYGRTATVDRAPTRAVPVDRTPTRTSAVTRVPPTRTSTVTRVPPTRTSAVTRVAPTRASTVTRVVPTRAPAVGRTARGPTLTSTVPRSSPGMVSQPRANPTRTTSVSRPTAPSRSSTAPRSGGFSSRSRPSPSKATTVRRPSTSGIFGRSGANPSRSSMTPRPSFGRSGGFNRPSSGGIGGSRSVPTARGR